MSTLLLAIGIPVAMAVYAAIAGVVSVAIEKLAGEHPADAKIFSWVWPLLPGVVPFVIVSLLFSGSRRVVVVLLNRRKAANKITEARVVTK